MTAAVHGAIVEHSKSFALASRLLDRTAREDVAVLYAWCRRADDEVDLAPRVEQRERVERLHDELAAVYAGKLLEEPVLVAFQALVQRRGIPEEYPLALLAGMRSDIGTVQIATNDELLVYCYRVAGVVGLMLCHVFGLSDPSARENAAHLGIAMQLTNICRDVLEDAQRHRRYLPTELLTASVEGENEREQVCRAVRRLLELAERYYRSADGGFYALPLRAALAARAARRVYAAIGQELAARDFDALAGRVVVPPWKKLALAALAVSEELWSRARRRLRPPRALPEAQRRAS
ncbi:MAG TPA: phytoene/squalene synthase family protein [Polyangiaceae bacterium]|nr:phytoene/squalene synthase family protein [Polyangiaceae bacterium]